MNNRLTAVIYSSNMSRLAVISTLLTGLIFDLSLALGVAGGVAYILPVLLTLNLKTKQSTYLVALISIVLTIIGFIFSPAGGELWKVLANRALAIFAITSVAIVIVIIKNINESLLIQNEQLKIQTEKAVIASKTKSRFLSAMSHEFKTPLNIIIGFTDLLKFSSNLDKSEQENLEHISEASSSLLNMVEGAISYANLQIDEQSQYKEATYIVPLVMTLIETNQSKIDKKKIKLNCEISKDEDVVVQSEPSSLIEVLQTIMSNAVQYTQPEGQITVKVEAQNSSNVRISISDTGEGIAEDLRDDVYKPFARLSWENSSESGLGLGLAKAKLLCDMLMIQIDYRSDENGTTFWLDIPIHGA